MPPRRPALGHTPYRRAIAGKWGPESCSPRSGPTAAGTLSRLMPTTTAFVTTGGAAGHPSARRHGNPRALDHRADHEHLIARDPRPGARSGRPHERDSFEHLGSQLGCQSNGRDRSGERFGPISCLEVWRRRRESNPCTRFCRPLPKPLGHVATDVYGWLPREDSNLG